jgi:hypothetical protein
MTVIMDAGIRSPATRCPSVASSAPREHAGRTHNSPAPAPDRSRCRAETDRGRPAPGRALDHPTDRAVTARDHQQSVARRRRLAGDPLHPRPVPRLDEFEPRGRPEAAFHLRSPGALHVARAGVSNDDDAPHCSPRPEKSFGSQPDPQLNDAVRSGRLPRRHDSVDDLGRSGAKVEVRLDLGEFKKADLGRSVGPRREGGPELNCRGHRSVCDDRYAGARGRSVGHAAVPGGRASFGAWPDGDKPRVITLGPSRTSNNLTSTLATAGFPRSRDTIGPSR